MLMGCRSERRGCGFFRPRIRVTALWAKRYQSSASRYSLSAGATGSVHGCSTAFCGTSLPWPLLLRDFPGVFLPAIISLLVVRACYRRQKVSA